MTYDYGGAYLRHPITTGQRAVFDCGSILAVQDITEGIPDFMCSADLVFVDPPWNKGNFRCFYTKAGLIESPEYDTFLSALFSAISRIRPITCYLEVGKERLAQFISAMQMLYPYVTFYNSTYYHRPKNLCYIVRASRHARHPKLDGMDEEDIIRWVCENEKYKTIGDLCMGRGLVAMNAKRCGKRFVGTELNPNRLSVTIERVVKLGGSYVMERYDG